MAWHTSHVCTGAFHATPCNSGCPVECVWSARSASWLRYREETEDLCMPSFRSFPLLPFEKQDGTLNVPSDGNGWKWMEMDGNGWKWMKHDETWWNMMKPKLLKDPKGVVNSQVYHETFMVHTDHSVGSELMGFHCDSMPATSVNKCTLQYTLHHFTCMFLKRHLLLYCMVLVAFVCVVKGLKPCECESLHLRTDQLSCLGSSTSECPIR